MINGSLVVLLGMQVPLSLRNITGYPPARALEIAMVVVSVVVATRMVWLHLATPALQSVDRSPAQPAVRQASADGGRLGGLPGAVSLAAALAVPVTTAAGTPVRERDLIIFVTVTVIVVAMLVQGTTLPAVVAWAGLMGDREREDEASWTRIRATEAGLAALPQVAAEVGAAPDTVDRIRADEDHLAPCSSTIGASSPGSVTATKIDDVVLREVQAALDIEEIRLLGPTTED